MAAPQIIAAHAIYLTVREQFRAEHLSRVTSSTILTHAMAQRPGFARVIGSTKEALAAYRDNQFIHTPHNRAHLTDRIETIKAMLEAQKPLTANELVDCYEARDETAMALSTQNKKIRDSAFVRFDRSDLFLSNPSVGFKFAQKREGVFLRELATKHLE